jgi:hypothetical protein
MALLQLYVPVAAHALWAYILLLVYAWRKVIGTTLCHGSACDEGFLYDSSLDSTYEGSSLLHSSVPCSTVQFPRLNKFAHANTTTAHLISYNKLDYAVGQPSQPLNDDKLLCLWSRVPIRSNTAIRYAERCAIIRGTVVGSIGHSLRA